MTPYEILKDRLAKHIYKRGAYKGDAPMDKRSKSHFRVVQGPDLMYVRMYNTNILTAFRNGEFEINLNGYDPSSTTRANINHALGVCRQHVSINNHNIMGLSQCTVYANGSRYVYYDGIRFNQHGELVSTPKPFEARRIDKEESKGFMDNLKVSRFKDVFPLLYATCPTPDGAPILPRYWDDYLQDAEQAHHWPHIISEYKYRLGRDNGTYGYYEIDNAKRCWARMMAEAKKHMYNNILTEVTKL
jgi:hypothetical protein